MIASLLITMLSLCGIAVGIALNRCLAKLTVEEKANAYLKVEVNRLNREVLNLKNTFDSRMNAETDVSWNNGFFEGLKSNGVALRSGNGRFTSKAGFFCALSK